jgi:hypothetical protein
MPVVLTEFQFSMTGGSNAIGTHRVPVPDDEWLQCDDPTKMSIQHFHQLPGGKAPHIQILPAQ